MRIWLVFLFATGGIGGVHRGAETTFDVSADLEELAHIRCRSLRWRQGLLDLPKTLEYLETGGVPVIGYRTGEFPAFWSRSMACLFRYASIPCRK